VPLSETSGFTAYVVLLSFSNDSYRFISELMPVDVFSMAGVHQQPEQSNYLAEDQILILKLETVATNNHQDQEWGTASHSPDSH